MELDRNIAHIYVILHLNHFSILSKGTDCEITTRDHSYLTISAFADNAEMVAVENYIDVGNVPIKFHLCLYTQSDQQFGRF